MNDYDTYEDVYESTDRLEDKEGPLFLPSAPEEPLIAVDFEDPAIASLPRVLLMGPRRGGKTSIQVCMMCVGGMSEVFRVTYVCAVYSMFFFARESSFKKCLRTKHCFD